MIAMTAAAGASRLYSCRLAKQRNPHKVEYAEHCEHPVQQAQPPVIQVVQRPSAPGANDGHERAAQIEQHEQSGEEQARAHGLHPGGQKHPSDDMRTDGLGARTDVPPAA